MYSYFSVLVGVHSFSISKDCKHYSQGLSPPLLSPHAPSDLAAVGDRRLSAFCIVHTAHCTLHTAHSSAGREMFQQHHRFCEECGRE